MKTKRIYRGVYKAVLLTVWLFILQCFFSLFEEDLLAPLYNHFDLSEKEWYYFDNDTLVSVFGLAFFFFIHRLVPSFLKEEYAK